MRLLTRADFDGLGCAAILKERGVINAWEFVHPNDMQRGLIKVNNGDILANVPYVEGCRMWFDHHLSEAERVAAAVEFEGEARIAPSASRIVYEYYGGESQMPYFDEMVSYIDKMDTGSLSYEEITNPQGWILLGFIVDPKTGLDKQTGFGASTERLMDILIDSCRTMGVDDILKLPEVEERVKAYRSQAEQYQEQIKRHTKTDKNVIITDIRGVKECFAANRFIIYAMYPQQNISLQVADAVDPGECLISVGYSILNMTANTNVSHLMLKYGGGGHLQVGSCRVARKDADRVVNEILAELKKDG